MLSPLRLLTVEGQQDRLFRLVTTATLQMAGLANRQRTGKFAVIIEHHQRHVSNNKPCLSSNNSASRGETVAQPLAINKPFERAKWRKSSLPTAARHCTPSPIATASRCARRSSVIRSTGGRRHDNRPEKECVTSARSDHESLPAFAPNPFQKTGKNNGAVKSTDRQRVTAKSCNIGQHHWLCPAEAVSEMRRRRDLGDFRRQTTGHQARQESRQTSGRRFIRLFHTQLPVGTFFGCRVF